MKPRTITRALAACAIAMLASGLGCAEGGSGPPVRPPSPFGTDPAPVSGSEPTIGGNDSLPGQGRTLEALCSAACTNLNKMCPGAPGADCQADCVDSGMRFPACVDEFRAFVACIATAPIFCGGLTLEVPACFREESALESCANSISR